MTRTKVVQCQQDANYYFEVNSDTSLSRKHGGECFKKTGGKCNRVNCKDLCNCDWKENGWRDGIKQYKWVRVSWTGVQMEGGPDKCMSKHMQAYQIDNDTGLGKQE